MPKERLDAQRDAQNLRTAGPQTGRATSAIPDVATIAQMPTEALIGLMGHPSLRSPANGALRAAVFGELGKRKGPQWVRQQAQSTQQDAGAGPNDRPPNPHVDPAVNPSTKTEHSYGEIEPDYHKLAEKPALFLEGKGDAADLHRSDVSQGKLGDCYFVASLAALADRNPGAIKNMIKDLGDGTYEVTFKEGTVIVDDQFPLKGGDAVYADKGDQADGEAEIWAMLLEKGWAKLKGGYEEIRGKKVKMQSGDAMEAVSGKQSTIRSTASMGTKDLLSLLAAADQKKLPMTAATRPKGRFDDDEVKEMGTKGVYCNHAYSVIEVDEAGGKIKLYNPWGPDSKTPELSIDDFKKYYKNIRINPK